MGSYAQVSYHDTLNKIINQVEVNYAGFPEKRERDTLYYYNFKTKLIADSIKTKEGCLKKINRYLSYFRNHHLSIVNLSKAKSVQYRFDSAYKQLEPNVSYLKISTFRLSCSRQIDSLIKANYTALTTKDYLIIDIRGNTGGVENSFHSLIPLFYTNPFTIPNMELYATHDNFECIKSFRDKKFSEDNEAKTGSFIPLLGTSNLIKINLKVSRINKPKYVAVLVDKNVASAAEKFVLIARQSRKVKVFGQNTSGCVDYGYIRMIKFFKDEFALSLPTARTMDLRHNSLDGNGIAPDFYITESDDPITHILSIIKQWE